MARRVWLSLLAVCFLSSGCLSRALRGYAETDAEAVTHPPAEWTAWTPAQQGGYLVAVGDFGSLTTDNLHLNAVPWKLLMALADVVPEAFYGRSRHDWAGAPGRPLQRFGLVYGAAVSNVVAPQPLAANPVGYAFGTVERTWPDVKLELASTNCSACHAGRLWGADGLPTSEAFFGAANHSLDFDAMVEAVARAVGDPKATDAALLAALVARFPDTGVEERESYRRYVLPAFRKELAEKMRAWGFVHPWRFGGPGFTHGAGILREELTGDGDPSHYPHAQMKVPNVFGSALKERILIDGSYHAKAEAQHERLVQMLVGFLPVFGTSIARSVTRAPELDKVAHFLEELAPPRYPGPIDEPLRAKGEALYQRRCRGCHGDDTRFGSHAVPLEEIGTDPNRSRAMDAALLGPFNHGPVGDFMTLEPTQVYVAPPLRGVWAQAPYLHNGSVPTLYDVLTPQHRPAKFWVGGHALDLHAVGIALAAEPSPDGSYDYPAGYVPWSEPKLFEAALPGNSNRGHESQVEGLSEQDKAELLEYLKTL